MFYNFPGILRICLKSNMILRWELREWRTSENLNMKKLQWTEERRLLDCWIFIWEKKTHAKYTSHFCTKLLRCLLSIALRIRFFLLYKITIENVYLLKMLKTQPPPFKSVSTLYDSICNETTILHPRHQNRIKIACLLIQLASRKIPYEGICQSR